MPIPQNWVIYFLVFPYEELLESESATISVISGLETEIEIEPDCEKLLELE